MVGRCEDLYLIATLQLLTNAHHASVDASTRTLITDLRVDMISEVEDGSTYRELIEVATRGEDEDLIFVELHLKLIHRIEAVGMLKHITNAREPLVKSCLALHAFIAPVGGDASFCNLIHPFGSDLHLDPFLLRTEHGDMQRLITIRLGH